MVVVAVICNDSQNAFKMHNARANINVHFSRIFAVQLSLCPLKGSGICHKHARIFRNMWKMADGAIFPLIIFPSIWQLAIDFDGDGKFDRIETFHEHVVRTDLNGMAITFELKSKTVPKIAFSDW
jgi:hypothetical protein